MIWNAQTLTNALATAKVPRKQIPTIVAMSWAMSKGDDSYVYGGDVPYSERYLGAFSIPQSAMNPSDGLNPFNLRDSSVIVARLAKDYPNGVEWHPAYASQFWAQYLPEIQAMVPDARQGQKVNPIESSGLAPNSADGLLTSVGTLRQNVFNSIRNMRNHIK